MHRDNGLDDGKLFINRKNLEQLNMHLYFGGMFAKDRKMGGHRKRSLHVSGMLWGWGW